MRKLLHYLAWSTLIIAMCLVWMPKAEAHPLGNFTINHYAGVQIAPNGVEIDYVLDLAEIPAFAEINQLDPQTTVEYPDRKCQEVNSHLKLFVNQKPLALSLVNSAIEFPPGVGGLSTLRLTCDFQGKKELIGKQQEVEFEDKLYPKRLGWREITVTTKGVNIQGNVTSSSISNRLRDYPNNLLSSPLNQHNVAFKLNPTLSSQVITPSTAPLSSLSADPLAGRNNDVFTSLITQDNLNFLSIPIALTIAFLWGGLHALSPGHGKTIVGAYLVGSRSNAQHAVFLGLIVTITHTASIFVLGLVALGSSQFILTEKLYPWLSIFSGVLVAVIGLNLLLQRWRKTDHGHSHSHEDDHSHDHHGHSHSHHHGHEHLPPSGSTKTWPNLLLLGISGGLLPCPSALVVLLSAISLGRIGFGLALVSAFSLGLAAVLTGIGLILVYAKGRFEHIPLQIPRIKLLPVAGALCITLIGLGITTQALLEQPWN